MTEGEESGANSGAEEAITVTATERRRTLEAVYHEMNAERRHRVLVEHGTLAFYSAVALAIGTATLDYRSKHVISAIGIGSAIAATAVVYALFAAAWVRLQLTAKGFDYATSRLAKAAEELGKLSGCPVCEGPKRSSRAGRGSAYVLLGLLTAVLLLLVWWPRWEWCVPMWLTGVILVMGLSFAGRCCDRDTRTSRNER